MDDVENRMHAKPFGEGAKVIGFIVHDDGRVQTPC